jgi:5-methyltetrahydropteroyltriglutamate--homocysteine methyltransferase
MPGHYRAEQVGSLLRPNELLQARTAHTEGKLTLEELRANEDQAILQALEKQRQLGLDVYTDGEMRRGSWLTDMADAVEGFVAARVDRNWKGPGGGLEGSSAKVVGGKLKKLRKMTGHEIPFLKKKAQGPFKAVPAPSNFMLASYKRGVTDKAYPDRDELLNDLVQIVRDEMQWLISQGVSYVQLDAPFYCHYHIDPFQLEKFRQEGLDPDKEMQKAIAGDNDCLKDLPRTNVTVAMHLCRGNSRSRWSAEGGYDSIAERLFETLDVDVFLLEYDTQRAGSFEPLRLVPRGKSVVLGLITSKEGKLESQDDLLRRIEEAARYVPIEDLALSPQCGFASVAAGNLLSIDDQWRKLELVVDTARKVWG